MMDGDGDGMGQDLAELGIRGEEHGLGSDDDG